MSPRSESIEVPLFADELELVKALAWNSVNRVEVVAASYLLQGMQFALHRAARDAGQSPEAYQAGLLRDYRASLAYRARSREVQLPLEEEPS